MSVYDGSKLLEAVHQQSNEHADKTQSSILLKSLRLQQIREQNELEKLRQRYIEETSSNEGYSTQSAQRVGSIVNEAKLTLGDTWFTQGHIDKSNKHSLPHASLSPANQISHQQQQLLSPILPAYYHHQLWLNEYQQAIRGHFLASCSWGTPTIFSPMEMSSCDYQQRSQTEVKK